jgi:hypothetical protein
LLAVFGNKLLKITQTGLRLNRILPAGSVRYLAWLSFSIRIKIADSVLL